MVDEKHLLGTWLDEEARPPLCLNCKYCHSEMLASQRKQLVIFIDELLKHAMMVTAIARLPEENCYAAK